MSPQPRITAVRIESPRLIVSFADGQTARVRLSRYPRLAAGDARQREVYRIIAQGQGIHWPELDEDLSAEGLLRDAERDESDRTGSTALS